MFFTNKIHENALYIAFGAFFGAKSFSQYWARIYWGIIFYLNILLTVFDVKKVFLEFLKFIIDIHIYIQG